MTEGDVMKTASWKSHDMRIICRLSRVKNLRAKQVSLLNKNYNQVEFKECLSNEGDTTLVKCEKR